MKEVLKYLETIVSDKQLENEEIDYFNLNPDWFEQLQKECKEITLPFIEYRDDQWSWHYINVLGKQITIDCRGWENKWGGWYFENDITTGYYHIWKDICFASKYTMFEELKENSVIFTKG